MGQDDITDHQPAVPAPGMQTPGMPDVGTPGATAEDAGPQPTPVRDADVPQTGDAVIDAVIAELAEVRERPLGEHIEAGEKAHRVLQGRLSDLGGE